MRRRISDPAMGHLFEVDQALPCPEGTALLRTFAENRSSDFAFLKESDFVHLSNSAFTGIPERDNFAEHYGSCRRCNA